MDYETRKAVAVAQRRALLRQQSSSQASIYQNHLIPPESSTQIKISPSQASSSPFSSSPHKNRYNSAIAALHTPPPSTSKQGKTGISLVSDAAITVPPDVEAEKGHEDIAKIHPKDPRAYFMHAQKPDGRTTRIKSGLLPLERLSTTSENESECTRNLTHILNTGTLVSRLQSSFSCSSSEHASCNHSPILRYNIEDDNDATAFEDAGVKEVKIWEETLIDLLHRIHRIDIQDNAINIDLIGTFTSIPTP
ncbi:MAG: hypothetical protein Q9180_001437 [Flavoplaca navasiana]